MLFDPQVAKRTFRQRAESIMRTDLSPAIDDTAWYSDLVSVFSRGSAWYSGHPRADIALELFWEFLDGGEHPAELLWESLQSPVEKQVCVSGKVSCSWHI